MSSLVPYIDSDEEGNFRDLVSTQKSIVRSKKVVQINIPVLVDSDDDYKTPKKMRKKTSGLFSVLPAPKNAVINAKNFLPTILTKKNTTKPASKLTFNDNKMIECNDSDSYKFDKDLWNITCNRKKKQPLAIIKITNDFQRTINSAPEVKQPYSGLNNNAFKRLIDAGSFNKHNNRLVDVNEDAVLPNRDVWMTKALTDPEYKPKYISEEPVNDTCRKKHHITYLAQRAKESECELQNQWAQNKYNRMQTQQKYGF